MVQDHQIETVSQTEGVKASWRLKITLAPRAMRK